MTLLTEMNEAHRQAFIKDTIKALLNKFEKELGIKILVAAEAGSRAWGFESPDSDWDIRFVYAYPTKHYLSIDPVSEVLDNNVEQFKALFEGTNAEELKLDFVGWDIRKALFQIRKSNAQVMEWATSPILYRDGCHADLLDALKRSLHAKPLIHHYRRTAEINFKEHIRAPKVSYKKYLYIVRSLLAARYAYELGVQVPVNFHDLRSQVVVDGPVNHDIDLLLSLKTKTLETDLNDRLQHLDDWINHELASWKNLLGVMDKMPAFESGVDYDDVLFNILNT